MPVADTNLVVRLLVADDADQARRARVAVERDGALLLTTVVLEAEWVLRSTYRLPRAEVVALLLGLLGLPGVVAEEGDRVLRALAWAAGGMGLADALHLAATPPGEVLLTFDRDLIRRARTLGLDAREP